jgi:hypothetical protein
MRSGAEALQVAHSLLAQASRCPEAVVRARRGFSRALTAETHPAAPSAPAAVKVVAVSVRVVTLGVWTIPIVVIRRGKLALTHF